MGKLMKLRRLRQEGGGRRGAGRGRGTRFVCYRDNRQRQGKVQRTCTLGLYLALQVMSNFSLQDTQIHAIHEHNMYFYSTIQYYTVLHSTYLVQLSVVLLFNT